VCVLLSAASPVSAQTIQQWIDRGYANLNIGFDSGSGSLDDAVTFQLYDENGTKTVQAEQESGAIFDFSVGARVWRNVSAGIGYHRGSNDGEAIVTAVVPHPVVFNQERRGTTTVSDLGRTESAVHLLLGYMIPINDKIDVHVTGGPSFFRLSQDVVSDVTFTEQAPFTSITLTPVLTERKESVTGGNIGADVTYKLVDTPDVATGVGMFLRYSGAGASVVVIQNEADSDVGGLQVGFGLRVRF
jgi:hypothetical protein